MRTSLGGNIHSLTFALGNQVDAFRAAHMDHMERATGLACQFESDTNCGQFSLDRTRIEIVPPMPTPRSSLLSDQGLDHGVVFSVNTNRQFPFCRSFHPLF